MSASPVGSAEEEARRLRQTLDSIDEAYLFVGRDWRVRDMNVAFQRLDGRPAARLIGRELFEVWPGLVGTSAEAECRRALSGGPAAIVHFRYRDRQRDLWLDARIFPSRDGLSVFLRDVGARVRLEARVRDAEADAAVAMQAARLGAFHYDPGTGRLHWNERHYELLSAAGDEPISYAAFLREIHPGDRAGVEHAMRLAIDPTGTGSLSVEYRSAAQDENGPRWIAALGRAYFEDGRCVRLSGVVQDVTDRRRAQLALEESEAYFRTIAQSAPVIIFLGGKSGNTFVNQRYRDYTGLSESDLLGDRWRAVMHPDDLTAARQIWAVAVPKRQQFEIEARLRQADGAWRWFLIRSAPVPLRDNNKELQWVGFAIDIHDFVLRREVEAALRESEARFRAIAEATPMIVFVAAPGGGNTYTNPQFSEYAGCAPSTLLGDGWMRVVHPADLDRTLRTWEEAVRCGGSYESEFRLRRHDGAYRWFLARGIPLRAPAVDGHPDGPVAQWLGACADIQELVEARQVLARDREQLEAIVADRTTALRDSLRRLNDSEARLRAVFESASDMLVVFSFDAVRGPVYVDVNGKALAAMGRSREQVIGRTQMEVLPDAALAAEIDMHCRAAVANGPQPYRYTAQRNYGDGAIRDIEVTAVAFEGPDGEQLLLLSIVDVTERRALEEQLRQSQKMEAVGQLTGGIAHDFNNLLTGISGSLELIQSRIAQGRVENLERYTSAALESVRRAASLTHRLLAFARRQALDPRPANLNSLVAGLEEMIRRTVGPEISVEIRLFPNLWPTLCDANQLENALLNLCINARDAMPEGGRLLIETANVELDAAYCVAHPDARPGQFAAVSVTDTGAGMPPDVASRAFEPFFTTKPLGQGTGLGLSMLYGFVIQSDGHVRIDTAPGRGTTVRIYLPRQLGDAATPEAPPADAAQVSSGGGKVVLVVEDEPIVRALVVEVLRELGHAVIEAADGAEALRALRGMARVDLLLTDVGLPGMNGRQLADAAREQRPGLKILFMTGYAHTAATDGVFLQPGMELLSKPFALDTLAGKLRGLLAS